MPDNTYHLFSTYARLRSDASVEPLPADASFWDRLMSGELGTFHNEFLVTCHVMDSDWSSWEMHPNGDEIVCLLSGSVTFVLDEPGGERRVRLTENGQFIVVPRGTWHTADVAKPARMFFITAGEGTQHRERS